jgi:L-ascorbate 6-phosphate lactonase
MQLAEQVARFESRRGEVALWSLGQSGFVLKGHGGVAVIDPYLSNSVEEASELPHGTWARSFAPPVAPEELGCVDVLLTTHAHQDHCDRVTIEAVLGASPSGRICGPYPVRQMLNEWGIPATRVMPFPLDHPVHVGGIEVTAVPAAHHGFDCNAAGEPAYVGYVLGFDGVRVYHAGDTLLYDGLEARLRPLRIDVALLPVNGRDAVRERLGIIGNTDAREAFWLAEAIGAPIVVPMHNDLFDVNRLPWPHVWSTLETFYPHLRCHRLQPGELMTVHTWAPGVRASA